MARTPSKTTEPEPEADAGTPLSALTHPEEMRATFDAEFGKFASMRATARCTPAGLVTVGVMVSSVLLSVAAIIWASRRRP
ncbi:hypothetical protein [Roseococcus sp. YIM B11640]|uniref:hypothetical protein n=1 Tax=Roseococcus sp. YIM B11640 TaxID=3133973 RepID=UPI003C7A0466